MFWDHRKLALQRSPCDPRNRELVSPSLVKVVLRAYGLVLIVFGVAALKRAPPAIAATAAATAVSVTIDLRPDLLVVIGGDIFPLRGGLYTKREGSEGRASSFGCYRTLWTYLTTKK